MSLKLSACALVLVYPLAAFAQDPAPPVPTPPVETPSDPAQPPPPPPPPPPAPMEPIPPPADVPPPPASDASAAPAAGPALKWEGLVDTYYLYKFSGDSTVEDPVFAGPAGGGRVFDTLGNTFSLAYAKLALQMDADPVGLRIDIGYGQVGAIINSFSKMGSDSSALAGGGALYSSAFIVQQAYAIAQFGVLTLDAGKFNTTAGAEVTESNKNWLYSRSFLFNAIPALHTGLRLTVKPSDMITIQGSLVNGGATNNDPDNNAFKTFGLSLSVAPAPTTLIAVTSYIGKEGPQGMQGDMIILLDLVASQSLGDNLALNLNFDYFKAPADAYWLGASLMAKLSVTEMLYFALRGEFISSKDGGYAGTPAMETTSLYEGTLMAGIPVGSNYELRLEARGDFSNKELFFKGTELKKNQFTGLAAFLAFF